MKYLRKFNESLSKEEYFEELVRKFKIAEGRRFRFSTRPYSLRLNSEGLIEYWGDLVLSDAFVKWWSGGDTSRIPFKIDKILGGGLTTSFSVTTLEGFPSYIEDYFGCHYPHQLTDLRGAPRFVGNDFYICSSKKLTSLEGGPVEVGRGYNVNGCGLTSLVGAPEQINYDFDCSRTNITDLIGAPKSINGDFECYDNKKLTSLRGCPDEIRGELVITNCPNLWDPYGLRDCRIGDGCLKDDDGMAPFSRIKKLFPSLEDFRYSLDYNYIKGPEKIDLFRFREALDELGIDYVKMNKRRKGGALDSLGNYKFYDGEGRQVNFHGELIN